MYLTSLAHCVAFISNDADEHHIRYDETFVLILAVVRTTPHLLFKRYIHLGCAFTLFPSTTRMFSEITPKVSSQTRKKPEKRSEIGEKEFSLCQLQTTGRTNIPAIGKGSEIIFCCASVERVCSCWVCTTVCAVYRLGKLNVWVIQSFGMSASNWQRKNKHENCSQLRPVQNENQEKIVSKVRLFTIWFLLFFRSPEWWRWRYASSP